MVTPSLSHSNTKRSFNGSKLKPRDNESTHTIITGEIPPTFILNSNNTKEIQFSLLLSDLTRQVFSPLKCDTPTLYISNSGTSFSVDTPNRLGTRGITWHLANANEPRMQGNAPRSRMLARTFSGFQKRRTILRSQASRSGPRSLATRPTISSHGHHNPLDLVLSSFVWFT